MVNPESPLHEEPQLPVTEEIPITVDASCLMDRRSFLHCLRKILDDKNMDTRQKSLVSLILVVVVTLYQLRFGG
jgi:hypothetical protein